MAEPLIRSRSQNDESVAKFFRRRFGPQIHDRLVAPFVTGIFAGNTEKLSVGAVFPRVVDIEREYGSVVWGMLRGKPKGKSSTPRRRSTISSFPSGMEALPQRIAENLTIQTECSGIRIGKDVQARATVLAVPAYRAAEVLGEMYPDTAAILDSVEYAPIVIATTSMPLNSLSSPLKGFGFLVPQSERLVILGTIFSSLLFSGRAPEDRLLLTSFLGGVMKPEVFRLAGRTHLGFRVFRVEAPLENVDTAGACRNLQAPASHPSIQHRASAARGCDSRGTGQD